MNRPEDIETGRISWPKAKQPRDQRKPRKVTPTQLVIAAIITVVMPVIGKPLFKAMGIGESGAVQVEGKATAR